MGTDATGMDIFSAASSTRRASTSRSPSLGTLHLGRDRHRCSARSPATTRAKRGLGAVRRAARSCAAPTCCRRFRSSSSRSPWSPCLGQSLQSIVLAIAFVNAPIYLRLMRSQVLSVRRMRYVEAAYIAGASDIGILSRHVIPNAIAPVLAQLSVNIGWAILLTAGAQLHRRRRRGADARMGQHDRHGLPEHHHRPLVAVDFPGSGAGHHRLRLRADRLQRRGAGRPGPPPRPCRTARRSASRRWRRGR